MKTISNLILSAFLIIAVVNITHGKSIIEFLNINQAEKLNFITLSARCQDEHKPSNALIADLRNLKFTDDNAVKCFIHCLMSRVGFYNSVANEIDLQTINKLMYPKDHQMAEQCKKESNGRDKCDFAYRFYKCLMIKYHG